MNMRKTIIVAVFVLSSLVGVARAEAIVVDNFSDFMPGAPEPFLEFEDGWAVGVTTTTPAYEETGLSGVVGDTRRTDLGSNDTNSYNSEDLLDPDVYIPVVAELYTAEPYSSLSISSDTGTSHTLSLVYDAGGAGLNLDAAGGSTFWADIWSDLTPSVLSMTVTDGMGHTSTVNGTWDSNVELNRDVYRFDFTDFTWMIDSIALDYSGALAADVTFFGITGDITAGPAPVPEPATMGLLGFGLLGLAATHIRKRKIA